jgi:chemotaxis protein methyltransferase CheR
MVEGRLRKRVRSLGLPSLDHYCNTLFDGGQLESEFTHLVDLVTTNKTDFFREPDHFRYLTTQAVPQLLATRRGKGDQRLKIWSAACSNGAEPYTLAMVLTELASQLRGFRFSILGTDICTEVLEQAVAAIYPEEFMQPVAPELLERYVMRARNASEYRVRIVPELRRVVHFQHLNLMDATYPIDRDVDVIFCRNILIYFNRPTQQAVLERLCSHLRPGGYLFLGHSEAAAGGNMAGMRSVAATIFRRQ